MPEYAWSETWDSAAVLDSKTNMHITSAERCTGFYELEAGLQLFGSPENKGHKYWHTFFKTYSLNRKHKAAKGHTVHSLVKEVALFNACSVIAYKINCRSAVTGRKSRTENMWKYVEIKCQLDATDDFYCRSYCLLNMFRALLCPSSGARE